MRRGAKKKDSRIVAIERVIAILQLEDSIQRKNAALRQLDQERSRQLDQMTEHLIQWRATHTGEREKEVSESIYKEESAREQALVRMIDYLNWQIRTRVKERNHLADQLHQLRRNRAKCAQNTQNGQTLCE